MAVSTLSLVAPDEVDGRIARGKRARTAIVDALLALIEAGELRPSAARIAERAGVSLRSVFQHFRDVESLFAAMADRQRRVKTNAPETRPQLIMMRPIQRRAPTFSRIRLLGTSRMK